MNLSWSLITVKIKDLKNHSKNPRKLSKDQEAQLQKSISKFGMADKPIINSDLTIIGGHQRIKILKKMGIKEIECWIPNSTLDENDVDELNIRLNKNVGEWDYDILANEWDINNLIEWGFDSEELFIESNKDEIENQEESSEILEPGKDENAITKLGDIYELNNHRLVCGDSTSEEFVDKCLNGKIPILMVTDPPYGVNYDPTWRQPHNTGFTKCGIVKNDDRIDWEIAWKLFPGSICYIWHGGKFAGEVQKSLEKCDFYIISQIIWVKQQFVFSRGDYHWQHEPCWYAVKKGHNHNYQGDRKQSTVWQIDNLNPFGKGQDKEDVTSHSTQKPIECMARPIRNNTAKEESIYDPFMGSGTTLIASEMLDRICYGIELSPAYCDIIVNRWINYMKKNNKTFLIKRNGKEFECLVEETK